MGPDAPPDLATPEAALARLSAAADPAALGALFDATSADLFRAAVALTGNAATAEDALQETYLAVLGAARRFEPGQPAMPWLVGILRHKAAHAHRARRVPGRARVPDRAGGPDGLSRLARGEDVKRVCSAIEGLPEPYRSAALLRWRYGLAPAEIAHVRGEPPGTVWSLLSRALDRLRRSLKGLPAAFLGWPRPRGLAAVRDAVVSKATAGGAGSALVSVAGGAVVATKATLVTVGVVAGLVGLGGVTLLRSGETSGRTEVAGASPAATPGVEPPSASPEAAVPGGLLAGRAAPRAPGPTTAPLSAGAPAAGTGEQPSAAGGDQGKAGGAIERTERAAKSAPASAAGASDDERAKMLVEALRHSKRIEEVVRRTGPSTPSRTQTASLRMESVDDLAERLQLDSRSRADIDEIVSVAAQDLLAVRRTPDERGKTWEQAQIETLRMVNGARVLDDTEVLGWRERGVPGRTEGETFGVVERRILERARDRIRDAVPPGQREAYDRLDVTPMFGPLPAPEMGQPSLRPKSVDAPTAK